MKYLLGIDLGSTSIKSVAFDCDGNIKAKASRPTVKSSQGPDHPNWIIWKPDDIWGAVCETLRTITQEIDDASKIAGVAVTGMGFDGLPMDEEGRCLYPFIQWQDDRSKKYNQWWLDEIGASTIFQKCSRPVLPPASINRMMWIKENEPDIYKKTYKWLLIEDFVNYMLCKKFVTDYSMAATTQVFDTHDLVWSSELLRIAGIDINILPEITSSGTVLGSIHQQAARQTGLLKGTPVVLGGHDYLCGAFAAGSIREDEIVNLTGTWELMMANTKKISAGNDLYKKGIFWDPHVIKGLYCVFSASVAADMVEWYRNEFCKIEEQAAKEKNTSIWDILMQDAAAIKPGCHGLMFLPHLSGAFCPVIDPDSKGSFVGITSNTTKGMFTRSIIEGLNYQSRQMVEELEKITGRMKTIRAIGGAVRNTFWMQNKADVFNRTIEVPDIDEATCLGAAVLAGMGVGLYKNEKDALEKIYRPGQIYKPDPGTSKLYEKCYDNIYLDLYKSLILINQKIQDSC